MIDEDEIRSRLRALLEAESTLVLSTAGDGPAGAPLFYLPDPQLRLHWLSSPRSRHSRRLAADPRAAVSVFASTFRWEEIRGAQMEGTVEAIAEGAERRPIVEAYAARFSLDASFDRVLAASVLYRFTPRWARLLDNSLGFPGRAEIAFP